MLLDLLFYFLSLFASTYLLNALENKWDSKRGSRPSLAKNCKDEREIELRNNTTALSLIIIF